MTLLQTNVPSLCTLWALSQHHHWATKEIADNREVKHDVYSKWLTAKMKLLPSVFSSLYSRIKIFVFAVNSNRHVSVFV